MAQYRFGYSDTPHPAPSNNPVISTGCPGTCGLDILAQYPVKERDPGAFSRTMHYMTISCVFTSNGGLNWSLEELRLQDYLSMRRPLSAKGASTPTSNGNEPSACLLLEMTKIT